MDIYEIKQRSEALSNKTEVMSITPTEVGGLIGDLATIVNENNINGSQLGIKQTYKSVAAMNEAASPVDYAGNPLKKGNLVIIYNESNVTDNNKIYTYLNPGWEFVTLLKNFENTELFYEIPGDITALNEGEGEDVVNKVKEVFGTIDGWFFVNQIDKDFLIDKNGITMSYRASSVGAGNYMFYISYYAQGVIVDLELFARQIFTSGPPTLDIERVTINKNPHILWDNSSNMNNYKDEGIFIVKGVHSNSGGNLPITAYANGNIGAVLSIAKSTVDESTGEYIIGQHLVIANKVGGETKEFIRSCIIKNDEETWTPWKESSMIQIFGEKSSGIAMRADIDAAIDNGQYAGVYMESDGFLPQGATFTLTVINNYAATAASSLPAENRQITQMFIYTPLSTNGSVNKSVVCKRDGIGGDSIAWDALENVGGGNTYNIGDIFELSTNSSNEDIVNIIGTPDDIQNAIKRKANFVLSEISLGLSTNVIVHYYSSYYEIIIIMGNVGYRPAGKKDYYKYTLSNINSKWKINKIISGRLNYSAIGTTEERINYDTVGFQMFDTTIGKPIWYNGTKWVDATGAEV